MKRLAHFREATLSVSILLLQNEFAYFGGKLVPLRVLILVALRRSEKQEVCHKMKESQTYVHSPQRN